MAIRLGPVIESWTSVAPLGVALYDLVTDARIVEGLRLTAQPVAGGRVTDAFQTVSGAYAFRGLDRMRHVEMPAEPRSDSPPVIRDFVVAVEDLRAQFLDTAFVVPVPTDGLVSQGTVFGPASPPSSPPAGELPLYLFSAPSRVLPSHVGVVRAQLADAATRTPAAHAVLEVTTNPLTTSSRRFTGVADAQGAVAVPIHYPRFAIPLGSLGSPPDPGTRGQPPADRTWPVEIRARFDPAAQEVIAGLTVPTIQSIVIQSFVDVWATAGTSAPQVSDDLQFGQDLILRTGGDPDSYLLIGSSP